MTWAFFNKLKIFFLVTLILGWPLTEAFGEKGFDLHLIRRIVVFPIQATGVDKDLLEEAWWQARDELTRGQRHVVASQQFLIKSDAFQPRADLQPADAILLGRFLDAHALMSVVLDDRNLAINVYDGATGVTLWHLERRLHPSLTIKDQLVSVLRKMIKQFVDDLPYQGFTVKDSLWEAPSILKDGETRVQLDLGADSRVEVGDLVQWIEISVHLLDPVFQGGGSIKVNAEGHVIRIEQGKVIARVDRSVPGYRLKEFSLVRIPRLVKLIENENKDLGKIVSSMAPSVLRPELGGAERADSEKRPLFTTLSFVGSLAAFLLLAF